MRRLIDAFKDILHAPKPSEGMFDASGAIILDPVPVADSIVLDTEQKSMRETLEAYLSNERFRAMQMERGEETFEDSLDFGDEGEDDHPGSPYSLEDERLIFEANERMRQGQGRPQAAGAALDADASDQGSDPPRQSARASQPLKKGAKAVSAGDDGDT